MGLTLITPASTLPVSLSAVKAHCGIEDSASDVVIEALRRAAHGHVERVLGRGLGTATWLLTLDEFADTIELPGGPVTAVNAAEFKYRDAAGAVQVVDAGLYSLDLTSDPQWLVRNWEASWPATLNAMGAVSVQFTAGWDETTLPGDLALAVLLLAANWFANREAVNVGNITSKMPYGVDDLLWPYRRIRI